MSRLTETSTLWGTTYRRRYYLNGRPVAESVAADLLRNHAWEDDGYDTPRAGVHRSHWNIGPRRDAPSLMDHPDIAGGSY